jgi:phage shock protein C
MEGTMTSEIKRLYRSRTDRYIGGVCGGLGEYLSIDPTIIRIIYILFALTGGSGIFIYLILLLVIPEEPWEEKSTTETEGEKSK